MRNRNRQQDTDGIITLIQMIITVCAVAATAVMPMFSQEEYKTVCSFFEKYLTVNEGDEHAKMIREVFSVKVTGNTEKELSAKGDKPMLPPDNATLAPYMVTGKISAPLKEYRLTCEYGWRFHPIDHSLDFHSGVDMAAPNGTEILSASDGVVTKVSYNDRIYGKCLTVQKNNLTFFYAHCSKINVSEGQTVNRGDVIAAVGTSGLSTGYHLHFEMEIDGVKVDPFTSILAEC